MNINQAAKQTGLPYSSARKYLVLLEDSGFFKSKIEEGARVFPDEAASLIARLARLSSDGVPLKEAIERLKGGDLEEKTKLDEIEKRLNDLTNGLAGISDLLQVELSKQKALPERSGQGFWYHLKAAFGSIFKK